MKTEKQILEARAAIYEQMRELTERAKKEERDMHADELEQFTKMDADYEKLTRQLDVVRQMKKRMAEMDAGGNDDERDVEPEQVEYRDVFEKFMRRGHRAKYSDTELQVLEARAQSVGTDSAGGYTVPDELMPEVIKVMKYFGGMLEAGQILNTSDGRQLLFPKLDDTSNTGAIIAENAADSEQDLTFAQVAIGAYMGTSRVIRVSVELLQDTAVPLERIIFDEFAKRLGRLFNQMFTTGTGTAQPEGVVTAATLNVAAASATAITRAEIVDLIHKVDRSYRNGAKVGFQFHDSTLAAIKKLSFGSGDDRPLWQPSVRVGEPDTLEGYPYWVNNDMATIATGNISMIFGDFSKYIIRFAGPMTAVRLTELYANYRQVGFNSFQRFDGKLLDTNAVAKLTQA